MLGTAIVEEHGVTAARRARGRIAGIAVAMLSAVLTPTASAAFLSLEHYGLQQGLSQSAVTSMAEDDRGFLWLGTQEGLNRFDGHRFRVYRSDDAEQPLLSSSIEALAFDARSRLWIGTNESGLEVLDLRRRDSVRWPSRDLSHGTVRHVLLQPDGGALLGTDAGVDRVDAQAGQPRGLGRTGQVVGLQRGADGHAYALDVDCRLYRIGVDALTPLTTDIADGPRCIGLEAVGDALWVASRFDGVWRLGFDGRTTARLPLPSRIELTALGRHGERSLLLGDVGGQLQRIDASGPTPQLEPVQVDRPIGSAILHLFQGRNGVLWIGTHTSGLFRARSLSAAILRDRISDADVAAWPTRSVRSILIDDGHQLIGTDAGLAWRRIGEADWRIQPAIGATSIRAILPHPDGGWWIGSHRGVWRLWPDGRSESLEELPNPQVTDLLRDGNSLWVATRGGLARLRHDRLVDDPLTQQLRDTFLTSLLRDDSGRLWIGSNDRGVFRLLPDGTVENLSTANGRLLHDSIWSLHFDDEAYWLGAFSGGLQKLERSGRGIHQYDTDDGLPNNVVYRILPDALGRLWLSTNNGIGVLDVRSGLIQVLGINDGLRNREYNSGASFIADDGTLYIGGTDGIDVIDPTKLEPTSATAHPVITRLNLLGRRGGEPAREIEMVYAPDIELDYRDSIVSLDMVAIDFTAPDAARLRYRLGGIYGDWVEPGGAHAELVLSYLPAGQYALEVEAAGRDGRFGNREQLTLRVLPPPWQHPLAYVGYALAAALMLLWMLTRVRAQTRRKREQIKLLNRTVAERTAELARANELLQHSNQQLEQAIRTDPLTQVSNRRDLQEWLQRETQLLLEGGGNGQPMRRLLFCMIDLDDFKRINDGSGHQVGDEVLVATASRLRRLCREHDIVVRWGGEEFLMLALHTGAAEASQLAERIRRSMADAPVQLQSGRELAVTCSIGFAQWPLSPQWPALGDWEQSVSLADRALYAAKDAGKNAWVGVAAGPAVDRACLQQLLAGVPPQLLHAGCVDVLHSDGIEPEVR